MISLPYSVAGIPAFLTAVSQIPKRLVAAFNGALTTSPLQERAGPLCGILDSRCPDEATQRQDNAAAGSSLPCLEVL
jgi:hypothetical protein